VPNPPPRSPPAPNRLARFPGVCLALFGIALVALACVFASKTTVAPIFAFGGIACVVLAVLLSRIEGDFELTATGLKARLQATQQIVEREDLTLDEKAEEIIDVVASPLRASAGSVYVFPHHGSTVAARGYRFEQAVQRHLEAQGWEVIPTPHADSGRDLIATRNGVTVAVVVKANRHLARADVERALASVTGPNAMKLILGVQPGALSAQARHFVAELGDRVMVVEVSDDEA
jgi:Holliday junction resolvase-like predicted endonuclease